ncbi:hypothetical protein OAT46_00540 [Gammaproteobacteria bacterium]|jgi:hypothetical protein|nr:hypothetical protein [Gammaproteobacteria bacterium]
MSELQIFVPAILSQLVWTVAFIFVAAVAVSIYDTVKKIGRRWGSIGLKPRYAMPYLARQGILS